MYGQVSSAGAWSLQGSFKGPQPNSVVFFGNKALSAGYCLRCMRRVREFARNSSDSSQLCILEGDWADWGHQSKLDLKTSHKMLKKKWKSTSLLVGHLQVLSNWRASNFI